MSEPKWNCGRCGYPAYSPVGEDEPDGSATHTHHCPVCGEQWWLDAFTYARMVAARAREA